MAIIGIDGGVGGGIAKLEGGYAEAWPLELWAGRLRGVVSPGDLVVIEAASQVFGTAAGPMRAPFAYVWSVAHAAGYCEGLGAVVKLVPAQRWQKVMYMGVEAEGKARSLAAVRARFPLVNLKASPRCKKDHDGMADALLIADYGRLFLASGDKAG